MRDRNLERARDRGAVRRDTDREPVAVLADDLVDHARADVRLGAADRGERFRGRRQAREHGGREDGARDEQRLAGDEPP